MVRFGALLCLIVVGGCSATPGVTHDLRPAYDAARTVAIAKYLDCNNISDVVCDCRRAGLTQEFANPSPARFDQGYEVLIAYKKNKANAGAPQRHGEAHAIRAIFTAIKADVEDICSYHETSSSNSDTNQ